MNERKRRKEFLSLIAKALEEMIVNKVVLLKRGDLFGNEEVDLYKDMYYEIKEVEQFIKNKGVIDTGYRQLQMNVFMKHESFFMNLFDTQKFPILFELFEFE